MKASSSVSLLKVATTFAALAASPRTNISAVGPVRSSFSSTTSAASAARSVSEFLTTRKVVSVSRSLERTSAICVTLMPR